MNSFLRCVGFLTSLVSCCVSIGCTETEVDSVCFDRIDTPATVYPKTPPPSYGQEMTTVIGPIAVNHAKWGADSAQPYSWPGRAVQKEETSSSVLEDQLIYEVRLPAESTLQRVHVWVEPAKGHAQIPWSRAQAMVWAYNGGFEFVEMLAGPMVVPGNSIADYEQRYLLTGELVEPFTMQPDTRIFIYVFGEFGKDTIPGLAIDTPEVVYEEP